MDTTSALSQAMSETGYIQAHGCNRSLLEFRDLTTDDPLNGLRQVKGAYDGCSRCHLCATRFQVAHYRGNPRAACVFLGEAPGTQEDAMGQPFVGKAGKFQTAMCDAAGIDGDNDVLWLNALGCRPARMTEKDRTPTDAELLACSERVYASLQAVRPRVVLCLGKVATKYFFDETPQVWGWTKIVPPEAPDDWVMVGYAHHPSYLVRVVGAPSMYKEYAAQRTFYARLKQKLEGLPKVSKWRILPKYLSTLSETRVAWHPAS